MKQKYQEYIVQKIYEFHVKAGNVHEAHDKASELMWKGAVGCSAVTEKEQKERYIALGMEEEYDSTLLRDPIFTDLAEATGMCIDDFASLKRAIEHLNPKRISRVRQALEIEAAKQTNGLEFNEGINYALELLVYGGEENYFEEEKDR